MPDAVVDTWYSLLPGATHPRNAPGFRRLPAGVRDGLLGVAVLRGLVLFGLSVRAPLVGMAREDPGWGTLLLLRALLGRRRKLLGFQYIVHARSHRAGRLLDAADRWAVRRALLRAHVLTRAEVRSVAAHYGLPEERFTFVPWPRATAALAPLRPVPAAPLVLCAGRASCDWPAVFAAARGAGWPLVVVCGERDAAEVRALNADGAAEVHVELPREAFAALIARATVSLVVMREHRRSQGQVRVADAAEAGVPVVATRTVGLEGYVEDGVTGLLVAPGDAAAVRAAVDRLLAEPALGEALRRAARERAAGWGAREYFAALEAFLAGSVPVLPPAAPTAAGR